MFIQDWIVWFPDLFSGLLMSIVVAATALVVGMPLGVVLGTGMAAKVKIVRWVSTIVVEFGRGIPTLVFLYLVYYGLSNFDIVLPSFPAAIVGLGLATGAYSSDLFRAGFEAVPKGETEAAKALGIKGIHVFWDVVMPQGLRISLPSLIGLSIQIFQATALAYQIALVELLSQAYTLGALTFKYLSVFALAAILYLLVAMPLSYLSQRLGAKRGVGRGRRGKGKRRSPVPATTTMPVIGR
ncbi:MAG: amino acid ABC transporter permease [Agrococcus casei]|uniref:amino acid ABC transporter permease n=1 Tax=Agrococcus casei TaxID=343512 RepID=UPI003F98527B